MIREMGTPKGHARQGSLETRLALIAAAPWKGALSVPSEQTLQKQPAPGRSLALSCLTVE